MDDVENEEKGPSREPFELRQIEEKYRLLHEYAGYAIFSYDPDLVLTEVNSTACEILGYEEDELLGRNIFELGVLHPGEIDMVKRGVELLFEGKTVTSEDLVYLRKDGNTAIVNTVAVPLTNDRGEVYEIINIAHDITARRRVEEELEMHRHGLEEMVQERTAELRKAKEELQRGEAYFRALAESISDLVIILDEKRTALYVSPSVERLLGYKVEEVKGSNAFDFIAPEDTKILRRLFERRLKIEGVSEELLFRVRHKDGSWRFFEAIGRNLMDDPSVKGIVVDARDITDRRQMMEALKESEETHRALVNISPDGVTISDLKGTITFISPRTVELHGYGSEEELLGTSAFELIAPEDRIKGFEELGRIVDMGVVRNSEYTLLRKDDTRFIAELNASVIKDTEGRSEAMVAFTRDITLRKWLERELITRSQELEAFAHTISHDLQASMSIIDGFSQAAQGALDEGDMELLKESLEHIEKVSKRVDGYIDSLLGYARAGHPEGEICRTEVEEVLMEVLTDFDQQIVNKGASVTIKDPLPAIMVDPLKLRQVFLNLIGNSLKYTVDEPRPLIELGAMVEGDRIILYIDDNGTGIPLEKLDDIFKPFERAAVMQPQGLGIGLSIVKRAVEAWGGEVWVESSPGEGATFFFTAPAANK
ncbi:MAG: PAS domain S-box protein [Actinomycetota bacterium]|nr:PAS domain S-box protein [Actinomycetota bacterium]